MSISRNQSSHVINFYDKFSLGNVSQDLTCCRNRVIDVDSDEQDDNDNDIKPDNLDLDSDFSESEIDYLEDIDCFTDVNVLPETGNSISSKLALDVTINEFIDTPVEKEILECKNVILNRFQTYETWYESQFSAIEDIALNCFSESATKFFSKTPA